MVLAVVHTGSAIVNGLVDGFVLIPLAIWDLITPQDHRLIARGAYWLYYPAWFAGLFLMIALIRWATDAASVAYLAVVILLVVLLALLVNSVF